ncbi:hypothetical protein [Promicromonospora sp. MEB111]|uniref:hypothetical protein n=1 Tax=Promicromonospora sp. MEB111 TaxID=3040301 RepID=UPI00255173F3|nr:hypothetical protein [Promicromonospora sp. MEB111]
MSFGSVGDVNNFIDRVGFVGALSLFRMTPVIQRADRSLATAVSLFVTSIARNDKSDFDQALEEIEECSARMGSTQVVFLDREYYVHTAAILCGYIAHPSVADRARMIRTVAADFWSSVDGLVDRGGDIPGVRLDGTLENIEMRWLDRDWESFQAPSGLTLLFNSRITAIVGTFAIREQIAVHAARAAGWS